MDNRYAVIEGDFRREIVLLKAYPCSYGKCTFCNYTLDNDLDGDANYLFNKELLNQVVGVNGILEVINSGNVVDLDEQTMALIKAVVIEKDIKVIYFEMYLNKLHEIKRIRSMFDIEVRFRLGLETFDDEFRQRLGKNFIFDNLKDKITDNYYSACLMVCIEGQTKESILNDIKLGLENFTTITVNKWVNNTTDIKSDDALSKWFIRDVYPDLLLNDRVEILIDNKDLGVFEQ